MFFLSKRNFIGRSPGRSEWGAGLRPRPFDSGYRFVSVRIGRAERHHELVEAAQKDRFYRRTVQTEKAGAKSNQNRKY